MCVRKHLLLIEALAEETSSMEVEPEKSKYLLQLAEAAKSKRDNEEKRLCGIETATEDLAAWARDERKIVEAWSLACELQPAAPQAPIDTVHIPSSTEKKTGAPSCSLPT